MQIWLRSCPAKGPRSEPLVVECSERQSYLSVPRVDPFSRLYFEPPPKLNSALLLAPLSRRLQITRADSRRYPRKAIRLPFAEREYRITPLFDSRGPVRPLGHKREPTLCDRSCVSRGPRSTDPVQRSRDTCESENVSSHGASIKELKRGCAKVCQPAFRCGRI